jgi:hypothetical protein
MDRIRFDSKCTKYFVCIDQVNYRDLRHPVSSYLHACFLPGKGEAITVTSDGEVIVWSNTSLKDLSRQQKNGTKSAIKYLK